MRSSARHWPSTPATSYATASQLANDVRQWRRGEAVVAHPETWGRRAQLGTLRRYKQPLIGRRRSRSCCWWPGWSARSCSRAASPSNVIVQWPSAPPGEDVLSFLTELLTPSDRHAVVTVPASAMCWRKRRPAPSTPAAQPQRQECVYRLLGHVRARHAAELVRAESLLTLGQRIGTDWLRRESSGSAAHATGSRWARGLSAMVHIPSRRRSCTHQSVCARHSARRTEDVSLAYAHLPPLIVVSADGARLLLDSSVAVRARVGSSRFGGDRLTTGLAGQRARTPTALRDRGSGAAYCHESLSARWALCPDRPRWSGAVRECNRRSSARRRHVRQRCCAKSDRCDGPSAVGARARALCTRRLVQLPGGGSFRPRRWSAKRSPRYASQLRPRGVKPPMRCATWPSCCPARG